MRQELRRARESGYLAAVVVGATVVVITGSLPLPLRLFVGLASGFTLFGLIRWEGSSEANHRLVVRVVSGVRTLYFGILAACLVIVVVAFILRG